MIADDARLTPPRCKKHTGSTGRRVNGSTGQWVKWVDRLTGHFHFHYIIPYQEYLRNVDRVQDAQEPQQFKPKKSRDFYLLFRQMLTKDSPIVTNYLKGYCNKDDCTFVFIKKIVQEKEIKLKEFNYKLLYGIL